MKRKFIVQSIGGTLFIFAFMLIVRTIGVQVELLNVFEQVFEDFELTDIYYSKLRSPADVKYEDRIVLVNIGPQTLGRRVTAEQLNILSKYQPKVIGIDALYSAEKEDDPVGDYLLAQAFLNCGNVVLGSEPIGSDEKAEIWDSLRVPIPMFLEAGVKTGHVSTGIGRDEEDEDAANFPTWRDFPPYVKLKDGRVEPSLAVSVMQLYDKAIADAFLQRGNDKEQIYFKGNLDKFTKLEVEDVLDENFEPELIKDKIVLIGYMGGEYTNYHFDEDRFYTPLNNRPIGRGIPDMYGVVVHANIVSMMLENNYINEMSPFLGYLIAILVCMLNIYLFTRIIHSRNLYLWYNAISKSIQLLETMILLAFNLFVFDVFNYQVDLSIMLFVILLSGDLAEIFVEVVWKGLERVFGKAA